MSSCLRTRTNSVKNQNNIDYVNNLRKLQAPVASTTAAATTATPAPATTPTTASPAATTPAATVSASATPSASTTAATTSPAPATTATPSTSTTPAAANTATAAQSSTTASATTGADTPALPPSGANIRGPSSMCAASTAVGGSTTSRSAHNDSDVCKYNPNNTCCTPKSFDAMKNWWQNKGKGQIESRAERYHRRVKESIRYTKYLIDWHDDIYQIADQNQSSRGISAECQSASAAFKLIVLPDDTKSIFNHYADICTTYMVSYTNTLICASCDPVGSTFMDGTNKEITLDTLDALKAAKACAEVVAFQK